MEQIKKMLFEKKAEENNTIDLNAYAIGLNEMAKYIEYEIKYVLETLKRETMLSDEGYLMVDELLKSLK